jgi:starch phosphorylase
MVKEYTERLYLPAARAHQEFVRNNCAAAAALSKWKAQMRKDWPQVAILAVEIGNKDRQNIEVGEALQISARVHLGAIAPSHVRVEVYHGEADNGGVRNPSVTSLGEGVPVEGEGSYIYHGSVPTSDSGTYGFSVRVVPIHPHMMQTHELRLITWS